MEKKEVKGFGELTELSQTMEGDPKKDILSVCRNELKTICSRLAENGEESVILTVNMAEKSCQYITSQMGEKFLSGRIELLEQFFKLCYDEYASSAVQNTTQSPGKQKNSILKDNFVSPKCCTYEIQHRKDVGDKNNSRPIQENGENNLRNELMSQDDGFEKVVVEEDKSLPVDDSYALTQNDLLISMDGSDNSTLDDDYCTDNNELASEQSSEMIQDEDQKSIEPVRVTSRQIKTPVRFSSFIVNNERISKSQTNKLDETKENRKRKHSEVDHSITRPLNSENINVKKKTLSAVLHEEKMENNVTKIMYGCPICGKSFAQCTYLSIHMASIHFHRCSICKKCGKMFDSEEDLKKHIKLEKHFEDVDDIFEDEDDQIKTLNYTCPTCGKTFSRAGKLSVHMASIHFIKCSICKDCGKIFESTELLRKHKREHTVSNNGNAVELEGVRKRKKMVKFTCPTCGNFFARATGLAHHMAAVHLKKYSVCGECGKLFDSMELLKNHKIEHLRSNHNGSTEGERRKKNTAKLSCPTCGKLFLQLRYLSVHMTNVHMDKRSLCGICCKMFDSKEDLIKHKTEHAKSDNENVSEVENMEEEITDSEHKVGEDNALNKINLTCPTCGETFSECKYLSVHMKSVHFDKRSVCKDCGKIFYSKAGLIKHQREHEEYDGENTAESDSDFEKEDEHGKLKFKCPSCFKSFDKFQYLSNHMISVHLDKRSICKQCGKVFDSKESLSKHSVFKHKKSTTDNDYVPPKHAKIKKSKGKMIRSTFQSSKRGMSAGEKKSSVLFKCPTCLKFFGNSQILKQHMALAHSTKCSICKDCGKFFDTTEDLLIHKSEHTHQKQDSVSGRKFTCPVCEKMFLRCQYLSWHMKVKHNQRCIICKYCGQFCDSEDGLKQHKIKHINSELENAAQSETEEGNMKISEVKFTCQICGKMFLKGRYLTDHMTGVHKTKGITCKRCGNFFISNDDYSNHKIEYCNELFNNTGSSKIVGRKKISKLKFICPDCGRMFSQGRYLTSHLATNHKKRASICIKCNRIFNSKRSLLNHKIKHTQPNYDYTIKGDYDVEEGELYIRKRSGDIFSYKTVTESEEKHVKKVAKKYKNDTQNGNVGGKDDADKNFEDIEGKNGTEPDWPTDFDESSQSVNEEENECASINNEMINSSNRQYSCEHCGRVFTVCSYLVSHLRYAHADGRCVCKYCAKMFPTILELREHYKLSHSNGRPEFNGVCEYCGKSFKTASQLDIHRRFHLGEKPYKCKFCGTGFSFSKTLKSHVDIYHSSQKYQCDECGQLLNTSTALCNHVKLHKREIINCIYCDSRFKTEGTYHLHLIRQHSSSLDWSKIDFKYIKCEYCSMMFTRKQHYERHVAKHTGEAKVTCAECGKVLSSLRSLEKHRYIHNPEKRYTCEICNISTNFDNKLSKHFASHNHRSNCEKLGLTLEESKKRVSVYRTAEEIAQQQEQITPNNEQEQITPINDDEEQITPNNDVSKDILKRDFSKEIPLAVSSIEDRTTECVIISLPDNIALPLGEGEVTYDLGDGTVIQSVL